ncbi:MAG: hypothetical protein GWN93_17260 [Deltaproteobacteria bacterium]|nr:hypothetical protein [Deltaproteobacteria bacterium]
MAEPIATIIMPTLDLDMAAQTSRLAKKTAGVPVSIFLYWDFKMRGAVKSSNALFKAALHMESPYIVYLNDDTVPQQQNWLKLLLKGLCQNENYGMACPSGNCSMPPQRTGRPGDPFKVHVVNKPLAWFCAVVKRKCLLDVGLFDERFKHYGDESDWLQRAFRKGWKQIWVQGVFIKHLRAGGGNDPNARLRNQWAKQDQRLYRRKWVHGKKGQVKGAK